MATPTASSLAPYSFSASLRRRRRRRPFNPNPNPNSNPNYSPSPSDQNTISLSIDLDSMSNRASKTLARFLTSASTAFHDFRTSVRIERGNHVVFSCRRSSIQLATNLVVFGLVVAAATRALGFLGFWRRLGFGEGRAVVRRDRSLGGRELVVGRIEPKKISVSASPLDFKGIERRKFSLRKGLKEEKLPEWWPRSVSTVVEDVELKREANRLVRAIMDDRLSGKDYKVDDIIQLHKICKISGARVSFGTSNARDSFYRASVDFVLNICSRVVQPSVAVQIDGVDARQFISGLADNIGLEDTSAARIVRASVAARARSCFLQSWAFEVQGKRFEVLVELSKICQIFQIFPPEEYSPEMEMVASGLKKTLGLEQRKHLLTLFGEVCGSKCQRIAEEALGLLRWNTCWHIDNDIADFKRTITKPNRRHFRPLQKVLVISWMNSM